MKFENIEKFRAFLTANLKKPFDTFDFDACLEDFSRQVNETGRYELSSHETISGNPETISFEREEHYFRDGHEVPPCDDFDDIETVITF